MFGTKETDLFELIEDLQEFDKPWDSPTTSHSCFSVSSDHSCPIPVTTTPTPTPTTRNTTTKFPFSYSKKEMKQRVHEVSCEEASYYLQTLISALNSYDMMTMTSLLVQLCIPDVLVMNYSYPVLKGDTKEGAGLNDQISSHPLIGIEQFTTYWRMIQDCVPDGVFFMKQAARPCTNDGDCSVYIGGVQFQGTSIARDNAFVFPHHHHHYGMNQYGIELSKVLLSGSIIVYVNRNGYIYRIDFYFEC